MKGQGAATRFQSSVFPRYRVWFDADEHQLDLEFQCRDCHGWRSDASCTCNPAERMARTIARIDANIDAIRRRHLDPPPE